jgi:hypothetical protein
MGPKYATLVVETVQLPDAFGIELRVMLKFDSEDQAKPVLDKLASPVTRDLVVEAVIEAGLDLESPFLT